MNHVRITSIRQAIQVFKKSNNTELKTLLNEPSRPSLQIERSSWESYLQSIHSLHPTNPWESLNRVARFLENVNVPEEARQFVQVMDTCLAFPGAASTRMDMNGKHIVFSDSWDRCITPAVIHALRGAHVTLVVDDIDKWPFAFTKPDSPIQVMSGEVPRSISYSPICSRPLVTQFLASMRLIRPMVREKFVFEIPEQVTELLTFLDPKDAKRFEENEINEFLEVLTELAHGGNPLDLAARPVDIMIEPIMSNSAIVKQAALAWLNPFAPISGMNRLIIPKETCNTDTIRFINFAQRHLGFSSESVVSFRNLPERLVIGKSENAIHNCDTDPFMLAAQHLTTGNTKSTREFTSTLIRVPQPEEI